jgi:hypothetical protein
LLFNITVLNMLRRAKSVRDKWFEITIIVKPSQQLYIESCVGYTLRSVDRKSAGRNKVKRIISPDIKHIRDSRPFSYYGEGRNKMFIVRRGYFVVSGIRTYSMYSMDFTGTREIPLVSTLRLIKSNKPTKARMIYRPKGSQTD